MTPPPTIAPTHYPSAPTSHSPENHPPAGTHTHQQEFTRRPTPIGDQQRKQHLVLPSHPPIPTSPSPVALHISPNNKAFSKASPVMMYRLHSPAHTLMNHVAFKLLRPGQHIMLSPGHRQFKTFKFSEIPTQVRQPVHLYPVAA